MYKKKLKMKIKWIGKGINEKCIWNNKVIIKIDKRYFRPTEVDLLIGDPTKAKEKFLGLNMVFGLHQMLISF